MGPPIPASPSLTALSWRLARALAAFTGSPREPDYKVGENLPDSPDKISLHNTEKLPYYTKITKINFFNLT